MFQSWIALVGSDWMFQKLHKTQKNIVISHTTNVREEFLFQKLKRFSCLIQNYSFLFVFFTFMVISFQEKFIIWHFFHWIFHNAQGLLSVNRTCHQLTGTVVRLEIWPQSLKGYKQRLKASPAQKCQYECQHISKQLTKPRQTFLSVWQDY